jgi:hypothetical protein
MSLPPYPCGGAPVDGACPQTPTYPARECTSGGAWWGSQYTGKPWPQGWGNADNWPAAARAARFNVTIQPSANSIMCIPPNTNGAGPKGHIAYVIGLAGPMAQVWEMNFLIEYGFDYRMARTANCEYIHLVPKATHGPLPPPNPPAHKGPPDMAMIRTPDGSIYLLLAGGKFIPLGDGGDVAILQTAGIEITTSPVSVLLQNELKKLPQS